MLNIHKRKISLSDNRSIISNFAGEVLVMGDNYYGGLGKGKKEVLLKIYYPKELSYLSTIVNIDKIKLGNAFS